MKKTHFRGILAIFAVLALVLGVSGCGSSNGGPEPTYGITLSETGTHTFQSATQGYGAQTTLAVSVTNTGNQATGTLTVSLSGANAGSFELSKSTVTSIPKEGQDTFSVKPKTGLTAGTYTATVRVSGGNGINASFGVSFSVNTAPSFGISLSETGTYTFPSAVEGYGDITPRSVTVTNTSNQATGPLTIALSGANASSFTLSATSLASIAVGGSLPNAFTVRPNTGLAEGTYTATVTVSGGGGITASCGVSFGVNGLGNQLTVPTVPQNFTATPSDRQVALSWTAPANNGGSAITKYEVSRDNGTTWGTASSNTGHTFYWLTNGTSYTFKVRAVNAVGNGAEATVTATPVVYGISLSDTGTYTFPSITQGYAVQDPRTVTVTNTGSQATGALSVVLSGTNANRFTLSSTTLDSIPAGGNKTFTVTPNDGLIVGTYTAIITVSGGNGITAQLNVSFTVLESNYLITNTAQWDNAISVIKNNGSGTTAQPMTYTLTINGNVAVPGMTLPFSIPHITVVLQGNGKLYLNSRGTIMFI